MNMNEHLAAENKYAQHPHWRTELNNVVMKRRLDLRYEFKVEGMPHEAQWTAVAFVGDRLYGAGLGKTKGEAKENASKVAYLALKDDSGEEGVKKTKPGAAKRQMAVEDAIMKKAGRSEGGQDAQKQ